MEKQREYICECGRVFNNSQSFNGHRSHCKEHLGEERYQKQLEKQRATQLLAIEATRRKSRERRESIQQEWIDEQHKCEKCGKIMTEKFATGRFCSVECANSKSHSEDTRLKIAKSLKEFYANCEVFDIRDYLDFSKYIPETREFYLNGVVHNRNLKYYLLDKVEGIDFVVCPYCGERMSHINFQHLAQHNKTTMDLKNEFGESYNITSQVTHRKMSESSSKNQRRLVKEGKHIGWKTRKIRSYAELFWERVLKNNGFQYEPEYVLKKADIGIDEKGCYFLDFLIDGYIDLEIDGKQHQYEERKEHDALRDERLKTNGFVIYRIPWINPVESEKVKQQIDDFLTWYINLDQFQLTQHTQ